ncbi:hypothetical protein [Oceanobacillus sojae]|uniref:hypothetical protein n=1 Tax=Oceanobacillus sojae TaxID=582851 RepID=UPI0009888E3F|nr:hypothetical protein [Oceanobacillus sojae]MCT1903688.1 hypothetical protein [Oceanobacillus sojae]
MEKEPMLKEILHALELHSQHIDKRFEQMDSKMDNMRTDLETKMDNMRTDLETKMDNMYTDLEARMDRGFDHLGKKIDGVRTDLTETQDTTDFLLSKTAQHEKKLRHYSEQQ